MIVKMITISLLLLLCAGVVFAEPVQQGDVVIPGPNPYPDEPFDTGPVSGIFNGQQYYMPIVFFSAG